MRAPAAQTAFARFRVYRMSGIMAKQLPMLALGWHK